MQSRKQLFYFKPLLIILLLHFPQLTGNLIHQKYIQLNQLYRDEITFHISLPMQRQNSKIKVN